MSDVVETPKEGHPPTAIRDLEEIKTLVMLQLPVVIWDVDMDVIKEYVCRALYQTDNGLVLSLNKNGVFVQWLHIFDPTYNHGEAIAPMSDDEIMAFHYGMYLFNSTDEAEAARKAHRDFRERNKKR